MIGIPLEHDHCKVRPRLTPEKAERVSGHYRIDGYNFGVTIVVSIATLVAMLLLSTIICCRL